MNIYFILVRAPEQEQQGANRIPIQGIQHFIFQRTYKHFCLFMYLLIQKLC